MTEIKKTNKPFGLSLSVKIALEAIRQSVAPTSVVLSNLFLIQKETSFPKDLDTSFFSINRYQATEIEKKVISQLMEKLKKPFVEPQPLLEETFLTNWVKKIPPKKESAPIKPTKHKQSKVVATKNQPKEPPTVTIKKSRLI
jgi:hypothetical protein